MSSYRLKARVDYARSMGPAYLGRHHMGFFRKCTDGSGKCTIRHTDAQDDIVHGVLFEISPAGKQTMYTVESLGVGNHERSVMVQRNGRLISAYTYVAVELHLDPHPRPYTWYKDFVLAGAEEHRLPAAYIDSIRAIPASADPDHERERRNTSILYGNV